MNLTWTWNSLEMPWLFDPTEKNTSLTLRNRNHLNGADLGWEAQIFRVFCHKYTNMIIYVQVTEPKIMCLRKAKICTWRTSSSAPCWAMIFPHLMSFYVGWSLLIAQCWVSNFWLGKCTLYFCFWIFWVQKVLKLHDFLSGNWKWPLWVDHVKGGQVTVKSAGGNKTWWVTWITKWVTTALVRRGLSI